MSKESFWQKEKPVIFWLGVISGIIVIALVLSYSFYQSALKAVEGEVRKELLIMAKQTARSIEDLIHTTVADLSWVAKFPEVRNIHEPETTRFFNSLRKKRQFMYVIFILNKQGKCIYVNPRDALPGVIGKDFSFREYFKQARRTGEPVVSGLITSGYYKDVKNKYKAIVVAVPILDKKGNFEGIIGTDIKVSFLAKRFILPLKVGKRGYAWMLDGEGNTLVHPNPKNIGVNVIKANISPDLTHLAERALLTKEAGSGSYTYKFKKLVSFAPVKFDGHIWLVAVSMPYQDIKELVYPMYLRLVGLMIFVVISIVVGGVLFISKLREVKKLKEKMVELEIKIDEERKRKEVEEITGTDYFKTLMEKAEEFKCSIKEGGEEA